jgi:predicted GNAT family acetyltransferase
MLDELSNWGGLYLQNSIEYVSFKRDLAARREGAQEIDILLPMMSDSDRGQGLAHAVDGRED